MKGWIDGNGPHSNIILSSRIRLARNINNIPFPDGLDTDRASEVVKTVGYSLENGVPDIGTFKSYNIQDMGQTERQVLVEQHLISPGLAKKSSGAAIISSDSIASVMVNEEDHIRIQVILPGLQIKKAWELASSMDDTMEQRLEYAYDERWGFLTCCPTNVGTGIRASVMVHLPALNITGNINKILQAVTQIGLTIRGLYGEGTEIIGNVFQISNQITLGRSEEEIVENLTGVTMQIIGKEKEARRILLENNRIQIEDKVWRSWGIMKNARIIPSQECLKLLSDIRLGVDLGILEEIPVSVLNEIMIDTQSASLQRHVGKELSAVERDIARADAIRNKLG